MTNISTEIPKQNLFTAIDSLLDDRSLFLTNPNSDFTRVKKIPFRQTILFPMTAGSDNTATELIDAFNEKDIPLPSAMIQRRNRVKPEAFQALFHRFTDTIPIQNTLKGHQVVACDGSRANLPYNPSDPDTFIQCIKGRKGINQIHLNCLYDVLNDLFLDTVLQPFHQMDEQGAFYSMLDRQKSGDLKQKRIYLADRGYASYNIFAHAINNGQLFLIRVAESFAKSLCGNDPFWQDVEFDQMKRIQIGRRRTKKLLQTKDYHFIPKRRRYDFIAPGSDEIDTLQLRVLKFPLTDNSSEYIVTNLPQYGFSLQDIKRLYNLRWNQETAYRHLKYAGNMVHIHSRKREFLLQEIYGKLTLYNFSAFLAMCVGKVQKATGKYIYVLNHTQVQKICIRFLRGIIKDPIPLICKYLVPVRPGRKFPRNLRSQTADTLTYR